MAEGIAQLAPRDVDRHPAVAAGKPLQGTAPEPGAHQLPESRMIGAGEQAALKPVIPLQSETDDRHPGPATGQELIGAKLHRRIEFQGTVAPGAPERGQRTAGEHQGRVDTQKIRGQGQGGGQRQARFVGIRTGQAGHQLQAHPQAGAVQRRYRPPQPPMRRGRGRWRREPGRKRTGNRVPRSGPRHWPGVGRSRYRRHPAGSIAGCRLSGRPPETKPRRRGRPPAPGRRGR